MLVTQLNCGLWEGTECVYSNVELLDTQWQVGLAGVGHTTELWVMGRDRMCVFKCVFWNSSVLSGR